MELSVVFDGTPRTSDLGSYAVMSEVANQYEMGRQAVPAAARTSTGFVIAWADESGTLTPPGESRLRQRSFDGVGAPTTDETALSEDGTSAREVFLTSDGDRVLAVWTQDSLVPFSRPSILARRLGGPGPDAVPFIVSETDGAQPAAAFLDSGDFAVAWVGRTADTRGDIRSRLVHATGDPLAGTTDVALTMTTMMTPIAEIAPSVLPLTGAEYLVTYEDGGPRRGVSLIQVGSTPLAPELSMALVPLLTSGLQGDVSLLRTPRGYWFAWSESGALGTPTALRSFVAYLLPPS
ncbi:hypothetical protein JYT86_00695 [bacterium AH-315-N03]|nr:hypothetical protein [bacterium AH-315-N03]